MGGRLTDLLLKDVAEDFGSVEPAQRISLLSPFRNGAGEAQTEALPS